VLLIEELTKSRVAFITRLGEGFIPDAKSVLQEGDLVHLLVTESEITIVEDALKNSPGGSE
jgi:trk system potassium uptake protein TrkA